MIGLIVLFAAFGVVLIVYFYTASPATSHGGKQKLNTTSNIKGNPNPFQSLETLRENLCGKLSDHAHELKVMLGLPDKNAQVTIAVDMEKIYDPCYKGMNESISALCEFCLVFLLIKSQTDKEEEHQTKEILAHLPSCPIPVHRILHYESSIGKTAFVRQIKPYLHIENDNSIYTSLRPHVPLIILHHCSNEVDLMEKSFPHQIDNYEELKNVELKV